MANMASVLIGYGVVSAERVTGHRSQQGVLEDGPHRGRDFWGQNTQEQLGANGPRPSQQSPYAPERGGKYAGPARWLDPPTVSGKNRTPMATTMLCKFQEAKI